jgi:hypothetical protein
MPRTYEPITSQTLGSSAASVTFSDIPATYTDLVIVCFAKSTGAASSAGGTLRLNSDTGSNYSHTILYGTGSAAASIRGAGDRMRVFGDIPTGEFTATTIQLMSYANTNVNKTVLSSYADAGALVARIVGLWRSTAAITSVSLFSNDAGADSFASGSTFSLYGIKAA